MDEAPRAEQVRRVASLVRTKQAVMELIKADVERRDPQHRKPLGVLLDSALGLSRLATKLFKPWKRVTFVLDIMHVVGYLWSAANALFGEGSKAGKRWVQAKLTEIREAGWLRHRRTATDPDEAEAPAVSAGGPHESHHVLPDPPALDEVRCEPGDGLARQDRRRGVGLRFRGQALDGGRRQTLEPRGGRGHADVALAHEEPRP